MMGKFNVFWQINIIHRIENNSNIMQHKEKNLSSVQVKLSLNNFELFFKVLYWL